jgi:hypothetical protein
MKPLTLKGLNLIRGLPMRGQRTHSNSKNILRFRNYFSSYILTIPRTNFYKYYSAIKESSVEIKEPKSKKKKKDI